MLKEISTATTFKEGDTVLRVHETRPYLHGFSAPSNAAYTITFHYLKQEVEAFTFRNITREDMIHLHNILGEYLRDSQ